MRILVCSDSHARQSNIYKMLYRHTDVQHLIFLGDGLRDLTDIEYTHTQLKVHQVAGNCDLGAMKKDTDLINIAKKLIMFTHGHTYNVKYGLSNLIQTAKSLKADIALFGHTHIPYQQYDNGLYIMNPGSIAFSRGGPNTYGIIDITQAGIVTNIVEL